MPLSAQTIIELTSDGEVWTQSKLASLMNSRNPCTQRTIERHLMGSGLIPPMPALHELCDENQTPVLERVLQADLEKAKNKRQRCLLVQSRRLETAKTILCARDGRGSLFWVVLTERNTTSVCDALEKISALINKKTAFFPHGDITRELRDLHTDNATAGKFDLLLGAYKKMPRAVEPKAKGSEYTLNKQQEQPLKELEAESIHILREAIATADNPVMLYSLGKDSSVLLHLARKAFYPSRLPMPLLHIDTKWKFQDMYQFRDKVTRSGDVNLLIYTNPEIDRLNISPFSHGSNVHTKLAKTDALKNALNEYAFDIIIGGARRDEEKSRAKERIFSVRNSAHAWDPRNQRPELWNIYNTRKNKGETIRVFPLSNWTEKDIWLYILKENIEIVPLYFASKRPVVERDGGFLLVDDNRFHFKEKEKVKWKSVRFRTLGCYPLTSAIESTATTLQEIIDELDGIKISERQGRLIDNDEAGSMELKKCEGYF